MRVAVCLVGAGLFLLCHVLLSPATLSYALMLDLRRRGRQWLESRDAGRRRLLALHDRTRWLDLTLPFLLSLLLYTAVWLLLPALASHAGELAPGGAAALGAAVLAGALLLLTVLPAWLVNRASDRWERWSDGVIQGAVATLRPLLAPLVWAGERLVVQGDLEAAEESLPEADLADVIEVGSHQGDLSLVQSELLRRELDFARKTAADVMVPRVQVEYLDIDLSFAAAREQVIASRFSRFPVQEGSVDNVVAVLHAKQMLRYSNGDSPESLRKLLALVVARPPLHVRFDQPLEDVLEALRREKTSLAVVDDVYGGVAGILTVEDVVEEIVGEIVDESDLEAARETFICSGRRTLAELAEHGILLPGEPDRTVAEFLGDHLGAEPHAGQAWTAGGCRLVVEATDADGGIEVVRAELDLPHARPVGEGR